MKKFIAFCFLCTVSIILCCCGQKNMCTEYDNLNSANRPFMTMVDDTLYYSKVDSDKNTIAIFKKSKFSEKELFKTNSIVTSLTYYDNNLIFEDNGSICMYDLKYKSSETLTEVENLLELKIKDGMIYYLDNYSIYELDIETCQKRIITDNALLSFDVSEEYIYYQAYSAEYPKGAIVKQRLDDDTQKEIIYEGTATYIKIYDGDIYFLNKNLIIPDVEADSKIYKLLNNGTLCALSDTEVSIFNMQDGYIFYADRDDNGNLYRMRTDGTGKEKIFDKETVSILVSDNEIFCQTRDNMYQDVYKIDLTTFAHSLVDLFK